MEDSWPYNIAQQWSGYAPLVIVVATWVDVFFVTGLVFNGLAMLTVALALYTTGLVSAHVMVVAAIIGTISGNLVNYAAGRWLGSTPLIQRALQRPAVHRAQSFLRTRGLLVFMVLCRFTTVTRPLYALTIGSMNISFRRFIIREVPLAICWVVFWIWVIVQGEALVMGWLG